MASRKVEGQTGLAVKAYERSLELDPNRADTLYNFANLIKDDDPGRAAEFHTTAVSSEPNAASAWHNYGTAFNSLTRYKDALLSLRFSLRLDPLVADVWCNLGLAYFGLEDFVSAERAFRHAIALDARHTASHTNLGNALIVSSSLKRLFYILRGCRAGPKLHTFSLESCFSIFTSR